MNNKIQENLIATIREVIPEGTNLTNYLSDILNIGRESVYRRLRGEINFTFEEVAILSKELNFSLDNLIGIKKDSNALFNIHMLQKMDYFDIYVNKILEYGKLFRESSAQMQTRARMSVNTIPYFFHISYEALSKLRIYKWLYQNQKIKPGDKYSDFLLPKRIYDTHDAFFKDIQTVPNITIIMDNNVFWSVTKDIEYFLKRNLLSDDDLIILKKELHRMVDVIEKMATEGVCRNGVKVEMYISAVDLEASYLHYEYGDNQFAQVRIYSISAIDSFDPGICTIQKQWMESQKRYSVLISESGEMQRFEYMNKQREYIDNISKEGRWI
jgi:BetR domain.